jgi:hypothetical protein
LTGKFQTDSLERRFGQYRQLSGGNYNVSVQQVLESEKKLRVSSMLSLKSNKLGHVAVSEFRSALSDDTRDVTPAVDKTDFADIPQALLRFSSSCDEQVLTYITGFVARKFMQRSKCMSCMNTFVTDRDLQVNTDPLNSYITAIDRGGLKFPTLLSVMFGYKVFCTFQMLVSAKYENKFLQDGHQRALVCNLVSEGVELDDYFLSEASEVCADCNKSANELLCKFMLPTFVNVFLNNYTKQRNDNLVASGGKKGKRKLQTLT